MMSNIAIAAVTLVMAAVLAIPLGLAALFFSPMFVAAPLALGAAGGTSQRV